MDLFIFSLWYSTSLVIHWGSCASLWSWAPLTDKGLGRWKPVATVLDFLVSISEKSLHGQGAYFCCCLFEQKIWTDYRRSITKFLFPKKVLQVQAFLHVSCDTHPSSSLVLSTWLLLARVFCPQSHHLQEALQNPFLWIRHLLCVIWQLLVTCSLRLLLNFPAVSCGIVSLPRSSSVAWPCCFCFYHCVSCHQQEIFVFNMYLII